MNFLVEADVLANPEAVDFGAVSLSQLEKAPGFSQLLTQTVMAKKRKGQFAIKKMTASSQSSSSP
jgi:hypothetical protein